MCICANMRMRMKISSTLSTYKYSPKMAIFWAKNGSAWLCFQFWVPKISLLFIPPGFIHPQEWKLRVQNHKILVKKRWFFFYYWCGLCALMRIWCASMRISKNRRMASPSFDHPTKCRIWANQYAPWRWIWSIRLKWEVWNLILLGGPVCLKHVLLPQLKVLLCLMLLDPLYWLNTSSDFS